jgi:hypothetical protein
MPNRESILPAGKGAMILPWRGDVVHNTMLLMLMQQKIEVTLEGVALNCRDIDVDSVRGVLQTVARNPPDPFQLASLIKAKHRDKHDIYLGEHLLTESCAARDIDIPAAMAAISDLTG